MRGRPLHRLLCDGHVPVLCILPCNRRCEVPSLFSSASAKRLRPLGCGPGLISDPVGQAKSVAFSVEGKAKAEALPQALFGASD
jgi:hypothetical protein